MIPAPRIVCDADGCTETYEVPPGIAANYRASGETFEAVLLATAQLSGWLILKRSHHCPKHREEGLAS